MLDGSLILCNRKFRGIPKMRTHAKMWIVASDRARRENVPRYILFIKNKDSWYYMKTGMLRR